MRKKIAIGLIVFTAFFAAGGIYIIQSIDRVISELETTITLHQVEILRKTLLNDVKAVQQDLLLKDSPHATEVDIFVRHGEKMGETIDVRVGDYVGLSGDMEHWPVDLSGLWGQVCAIQDLEEQSTLVLHLRFMAYSLEIKRSIIQLVYQQQEKEKAKKQPRSAAKGSKAPQKKRPVKKEHPS